MLALEHAQVLTPDGILADGTLLIENDRIGAVGPSNTLEVPAAAERTDLSGGIIAPGFIDSHTHGGFGYDFMACTPEEARWALDRYARHGVTGVLATIASCSQSRGLEILETLAPLVRETETRARLLGFHLEGPYISRQKAGAQPKEPIRRADICEMDALLRASGNTVRLVTVAPEIPGGLELIRHLKEAGVVVAIGHSNADYETTMAAIAAGVTRATHTFNGMSGLHHRKPGIPGAVLTSEAVYCEVIADGHHVHPSVIDLLIRLKGQNRVILMSDSNQAAGLDDGTYVRPGDRQITVRDGAAWLPNGSLAGSVLTLDIAVARLVKLQGHLVEAALAMAGHTPAASLGLASDYGQIKPGALADLVVLSQDLEVESTYIGGKIIH